MIASYNYNNYIRFIINIYLSIQQFINIIYEIYNSKLTLCFLFKFICLQIYQKIKKYIKDIEYNTLSYFEQKLTLLL
jgi:transglutaminase/protease-like cytokinesis protein 3